MKRRNKKQGKVYTFRDTKRVVIYLRVSSDEQAREAYGLESQLAACRKFCVERGWIAVEVYRDAGTSGWEHVDRPQFKRMMEFIRKDRNVNLVFYDYSRFYRDTLRALKEFDELDELGIYSVSVSNPTIDCRRAAGRTARREELSKAEDFSDTHSEKQQERMRVAMVERGQYPGRGPLGYQNVPRRKGKDEPNIRPLEPHFSLMRQAFELIESGSYNLAGCLRDMTQRGLRSMSGKVLTAGELSRMLRNPAYIGKIPTSKHGVLPGCHVPCVKEATFQKVQMILDGKKPSISLYQRNRPELPLRQFLLCAKCGYGVTGGGVKNRYGQIYFYYWCRKPECRYVHVRAERVHRDFQDVLKAFKVNAHLGEDFVASLREKWKAKNGNSHNVITKLRGELQTAEDRKQRLLMRYLDGDSAIQQNFQTMQSRLDNEIEILKKQIEESEIARATFDDLLVFTRKMPSELDRIWIQAPIDLQQKVQNLLFRGGIKYVPETGFLNQDNAHVFNQLRYFLAGNLEMVGAERIEPPRSYHSRSFCHQVGRTKNSRQRRLVRGDLPLRTPRRGSGKSEQSQ